MFTGIIEERGIIKKIERGPESFSLHIQAKEVIQDIRIGDSIATNGVCLTATKLDKDYFIADVMPETMTRTNLGKLQIGSPVNLERALRLMDRLNGHLVTGHVDCEGRITKKYMKGNAWIIMINVPGGYERYMIPQGSITLDGISLTIVEVRGTTVTVSIIPHTASHTTLLDKTVGANINIECDHLGKYVERFVTLNKEENNVANKGVSIYEQF